MDTLSEIVSERGIEMNNVAGENESFNADEITSPEKCDKSAKILIDVDKNGEDDDGQRNILNENDTSTCKKNEHDENGTRSDSSLSWRDLYPQVLASCISLLMVIQPGINLAYSNNLLHYMPELNKGQFSWITSILALCTPIGAFSIGLIMDRVGRKHACLMTCLPLLTSWMISAISSADNVYMFYASRMFAGIGAGMTTVGIVYVSEISHSSYKQLLLSLNSVFFSGGVLLATTLTYLDWNVINVAFIGFTVTNMALIMVYMPESPIWLLKFKSAEYTGKAKAAVKKIYRNNKQLYKTEWKRLKASSKSGGGGCDGADAVDGPPSFVGSMRSDAAAYRPMAVLTVLLLLQQLTGAYPTISYALPVLKLIVADGRCPIGEIESLAVLGGIRFVSGLAACALSFHVGRKPLLTVSCVGMALSSALVVCTFDERAATATAPPDTIPLSLCGVMLYVFNSSLGVLVFPWTLICELLPTSVRAVGGCLLVSYCYLLMFAVLKAFPYVLAALSVSDVFAIFGAVSLLMAVYVNYAVPETLGKDFREIEDHFARPNDRKIRPRDTC